MKDTLIKKYTVISILVFAIVMISNSKTAIARGDSTSIYEANWKPFSIEIGGYLTSINSNFRIGEDNTGVGLDINFEEALGLTTTSATFRGQFLYRFTENRRHAIRASYFQISRSASKNIEVGFEIDEQKYTTDSFVTTNFDFKVIKVDYRYSFYLDDRVNLNASLGLFLMPFDISVRKEEEPEDHRVFVTPLPVVGISTHFQITPKLSLKYRSNMFYIKLDNSQGSMLDMNVLVEYRLLPRWGIGAGYNAFSLDLKEKKDGDWIIGDFTGKIGYRHSGILFYGVFVF